MEAAPYVAWNFKAVPGFMDIVTWTGNGSSGLRSISHNLGSTPAFLITKNCIVMELDGHAGIKI